MCQSPVSFPIVRLGGEWEPPHIPGSKKIPFFSPSPPPLPVIDPPEEIIRENYSFTAPPDQLSLPWSHSYKDSHGPLCLTFLSFGLGLDDILSETYESFEKYGKRVICVVRNQADWVNPSSSRVYKLTFIFSCEEGCQENVWDVGKEAVGQDFCEPEGVVHRCSTMFVKCNGCVMWNARSFLVIKGDAERYEKLPSLRSRSTERVLQQFWRLCISNSRHCVASFYERGRCQALLTAE
jgi:hypothetical protein